MHDPHIDEHTEKYADAIKYENRKTWKEEGHTGVSDVFVHIFIYLTYVGSGLNENGFLRLLRFEDSAMRNGVT